MEVIYSSDNKSIVENCAATVGFFDGVHAGHRYLIEELKLKAKKNNLKSVVITFAEHPRKILHSDFQPALLTALDEKLSLLESTGIDRCIILNFNIKTAKLSAYEFLKNILFDNFRVRFLLVGHDHRFGHNRLEGFEEYKKYGEDIGIRVEQASRFKTQEINHISSSVIRTALKNGEIEKANNILTYHYSFIGKVITGFKVGRKIGFPTANIKPENIEKLIPALGVYAVVIYRKGLLLKGMMNIGFRPTLNNGTKISMEVNIFDFNEDIYNETLKISFLRKIRNERKFNSVDELIAQLHLDKQEISSYFKD